MALTTCLRTPHRAAVISGLVLAWCPTPLLAEARYHVAWLSQFGTEGDDPGYGVGVDGFGNVYVAGRTTGSLGGANAGFDDIFLTKFDPSGELLWGTQLGTERTDTCWGMTVDGAGNAYITGYTNGSLGGPNVGGHDAYLTKHDSAGNLLWSVQIGTAGTDWGRGVAVDAAGDVYVTGETGGALAGANKGGADAFLMKYAAAGDLLWSRQFGSAANDISNGVAVDALGNLYLSGYTSGNLGGPSASPGVFDFFLAKCDPAGAPLWTRQFGTAGQDVGRRVAIDASGNAYIAGWVAGSLGGPHAGGDDAFLAKYDPAGNLLWSSQLGTAANDSSWGVAVDAAGDVYVTGETAGALGGASNGGSDAFVSKYDPAGALVWTRQLGTSASEGGLGISADRLGNVYISGFTEGSLGGPNAGQQDSFVAKLVPPSVVPDPPGDFDFDGDTDGADFLAWQRGESPTPLSSTDFSAWRATFGAQPDATAQSGVPEPSTSSLVAAALTLMVTRRRAPVANAPGSIWRAPRSRAR